MWLENEGGNDLSSIDKIFYKRNVLNFGQRNFFLVLIYALWNSDIKTTIGTVEE